MLEGRSEKQTGRRTQHDVPEAVGWWMIHRSGTGGEEVMTLPCGGGEALALFGHEEEAEPFLWSLALDGLENGWHARKSRYAEIASVLYGTAANARRVALDPLPVMAEEGTVELVSLDRFDFLAGLLARDEERTRPGDRSCGNASGQQPNYGRRFCALRPPGRSRFVPDELLGSRAEPE